MERLFKLAEAVLALRRLAGRLGAAAGRVGAALACVLVAAAFAAAALGCGFAALWLYALPLVGPVGAPLVVAGALLVVALALLLLARRMVQLPVAAPAPSSKAVSAEIDKLMAEHKTEMLLAALVAGMCVGAGNKRG